MSPEDMVTYFNRLENQSKALKEEALRLAWYMRGSVSYDEAMLLTDTDRAIISKIVKDNLETSKKSGMPFF
jgi:signal-transduction protein with cAMP-binding, CBS, and nucleotidyltransferase domain